MGSLTWQQHQKLWVELSKKYDEVVDDLIAAYREAGWPAKTHLREEVYTGRKWLGLARNYETRFTRTIVFGSIVTQYTLCEDGRVFEASANSWLAELQDPSYKPWGDLRPIGDSPSARGRFVEEALERFYRN